jgi:hypothetical protein
MTNCSFVPYHTILALELAKSALISINKFFLQKFDMVIIKWKICAEFVSVEKSAKEIHP